MELGSFGLIPDVFISDFALFLFPGLILRPFCTKTG